MAEMIFGKLLMLAFAFANAPQKHSVALIFFEDAQPNLQQFLAYEVKKFYNCNVAILPARKLPRNAYYRPRKRYKADTILRFLHTLKSSRFEKIVGITDKDISTRKKQYADYGVMGLANFNEDAVVSSFRLRKGINSRQHFAKRLLTTTLHELGHTLAVRHCSSGSKVCFMRAAEGTIKNIDASEVFMCQKCRSSIRW